MPSVSGARKERTLPVSYSLPGEFKYDYVIIPSGPFSIFFRSVQVFEAKIYIFPSFVCRAEMLLPY